MCLIQESKGFEQKTSATDLSTRFCLKCLSVFCFLRNNLEKQTTIHNRFRKGRFSHSLLIESKVLSSKTYVLCQEFVDSDTLIYDPEEYELAATVETFTRQIPKSRVRAAHSSFPMSAKPCIDRILSLFRQQELPVDFLTQINYLKGCIDRHSPKCKN